MVTFRKIILSFTFKLWQLVHYIWRMCLHFQETTHLRKMINSKILFSVKEDKGWFQVVCLNYFFHSFTFAFDFFDSYRTCQIIKNRCWRDKSVVKCTFALIEGAGLFYSIYKVILSGTPVLECQIPLSDLSEHQECNGAHAYKKMHKFFF